MTIRSDDAKRVGGTPNLEVVSVGPMMMLVLHRTDDELKAWCCSLLAWRPPLEEVPGLVSKAAAGPLSILLKLMPVNVFKKLCLQTFSWPLARRFQSSRGWPPRRRRCRSKWNTRRANVRSFARDPECRRIPARGCYFAPRSRRGGCINQLAALINAGLQAQTLANQRHR